MPYFYVSLNNKTIGGDIGLISSLTIKLFDFEKPGKRNHSSYNLKKGYNNDHQGWNVCLWGEGGWNVVLH